MKTKEQIGRHLLNCSFTDDDWKLVLAFCRENYGGGVAHRAIRPKYESTYDEFVEWESKGFGSGDVARSGNIIGIVGDGYKGHLFFAVYLDGEKIVADKLDVDALEPVSDDVKSAFLKKVALSGYRYVVGAATVRKFQPPKINEKIEYNRGLVHGVGVLKQYAEEVVFHFAIEDHVIIPDMSCSINDISFSAITYSGIRIISETLAHHGLTWNRKHCKLEPINLRASVGETYWYITDRFTVISAKDHRKTADNTRYKVGNYFTDYSDALSFLLAIKKIRGVQ